MRLAGVWILIDSKNRVLLLKRSDYTKSFPWYWTMPWGRWEKWETAEQIVVREVFEETGLNFEPKSLYYTTETMNSWEEIFSHRFLWEFSWKINIQEEEADWYAWYSYEECLNLKVAFDYLNVIKQLYKEWILK